jgi:hypothetical protein
MFTWGLVQSVQWLGYGLDDRGSFLGGGRDFFLFATASGPTLGPTQHRIQWVMGDLSLRVKRPGPEADYSPPSSADWSYTSTLPCVFMAWRLVKHRDNLTLPLPYQKVTHLCYRGSQFSWSRIKANTNLLLPFQSQPFWGPLTRSLTSFFINLAAKV